MEGTISLSTEHLAEEIAKKIIDHFSGQFTSSLEEPQLLTSEEVAKICKVKSLSTLWYWRKQGLLIPTSRAGRKPLYRQQDVMEFLERRNGGSNV